MNRRNFIRSSTAGLAFAYASLFGLKAKEEDNNLSFDVPTGRKWDSIEEAGPITWHTNNDGVLVIDANGNRLSDVQSWVIEALNNA